VWRGLYAEGSLEGRYGGSSLRACVSIEHVGKMIGMIYKGAPFSKLTSGAPMLILFYGRLGVRVGVRVRVRPRVMVRLWVCSGFRDDLLAESRRVALAGIGNLRGSTLAHHYIHSAGKK
jgi:hypothetical protein